MGTGQHLQMSGSSSGFKSQSGQLNAESKQSNHIAITGSIDAITNRVTIKHHALNRHNTAAATTRRARGSSVTPGPESPETAVSPRTLIPILVSKVCVIILFIDICNCSLSYQLLQLTGSVIHAKTSIDTVRSIAVPSYSSLYNSSHPEQRPADVTVAMTT